MEKPREWSIWEGDTDRPTIKGDSIAYAEIVHVIEKSAYDELVRETAQLKSEKDSLRERLREAQDVSEEFKQAAETKRIWSLVDAARGDAKREREEWARVKAKVRDSFEMALAGWSEWIHDQLDGTSLLDDAIAEVESCGQALTLLSKSGSEG